MAYIYSKWYYFGSVENAASQVNEIVQFSFGVNCTDMQELITSNLGQAGEEKEEGEEIYLG